MFRGQHSRSNA